MSLAPIALRQADTTDTGMSDRTCTSAQVILQGIESLVEGQRAFAEALGVRLPCVFGDTCHLFRKNPTAAVLNTWFNDPVQGPLNFGHLFSDLLDHHLAMFAALDGVAKESLSSLHPTKIKQRSFRLFGWRPFAWFTFRRLHKSFTSNDYLRHQELVVKGFAKAYCTHRQQLHAAQSTPPTGRQSETKGESNE